MFFVLGISILLVALLVLNNAASLLAMLLWRIFRGRINHWPAQRTAQTLFLLRTAPVILSVAVVFFLFAPAYLRHESRTNYEELSGKLALLAILSLISIAVAVVRGIAAWRATNRLTAEWRRDAKQIHIPRITAPAFEVEHPFPLIAVVGAFRPQLFIAKQIFQSLTTAELAAALQHENAHIRAYDNVKRTLVRACGDMTFIPLGRDIDSAWLEASESAADELAAKEDHQLGLDLASAIVKIARLIPPGTRPAMTAGAFLAGDESGFRSRVRRLLETPANQQLKTADTGLIAQFRILIPAALTLILVALTIESHILPAIHGVIEHAVHILS